VITGDLPAASARSGAAAAHMSLADVYHYGTQHFDFHPAQLTLNKPGR
jgi:hypothetical protein